VITGNGDRTTWGTLSNGSPGGGVVLATYELGMDALGGMKAYPTGLREKRGEVRKRGGKRGGRRTGKK